VKICQQCKSINGDDYKFCTSCGAKREATSLGCSIDNAETTDSNIVSPSGYQKTSNKRLWALCLMIFAFSVYQFLQGMKPAYVDGHYPRKPSSPFENTVSHTDCQKAFDAKGVSHEKVNAEINKYSLDGKSYTTEKRDGFKFFLDKKNYHIALYDNSGLLISLAQYNERGKSIYYKEGNTARFAMYGICYNAVSGGHIRHVKGFKRFDEG